MWRHVKRASHCIVFQFFSFLNTEVTWLFLHCNTSYHVSNDEHIFHPHLSTCKTIAYGRRKAWFLVLFKEAHCIIISQNWKQAVDKKKIKVKQATSDPTLTFVINIIWFYTYTHAFLLFYTHGHGGTNIACFCPSDSSLTVYSNLHLEIKIIKHYDSFSNGVIVPVWQCRPSTGDRKTRTPRQMLC